MYQGLHLGALHTLFLNLCKVEMMLCNSYSYLLLCNKCSKTQWLKTTNT